ncbi:hypothetical protein [Naumannella halotolerans]|uniref:Integral membrane protein n=1 Tax=Naumannella halotolerans TaxID=993414 RepID=A0A4R7J8M9_9ACTN|nr:hypothetical protein [Naumannella halotolerans]TDT33665.1 hypothetical protein CLV29_1290 [Naumannella halotolerans]
MSTRVAARPIPVLLAVAIVAALGLLFIVLAILELANTNPIRPQVAISTGIGFLAYAGLLLAAARGLLGLRRWARSAAVFAALLQIPIAISFWGGSTRAVTVLGLLSSLVIIGCLVSPPATRAILPELHEPDTSRTDE